jgi:hypothetical protein
MSAPPLRTALAAVLLSALTCPAGAGKQTQASRPNILWLVLDDASPALGSYGDPQAIEVRKDLAQFYDLMTAADYTIGDVLDWLDTNGLADNTVVFVFGDHGTGMPRSKRWVYDSGIRVPLLIRWPGHIAANLLRDDLVSFIDFAPTVLALAGVDVPRTMQGQVFLGGARDRQGIHLRNARSYGRDVRSNPQRARQAVQIHPQLPSGAAVRAGQRLQRTESDGSARATMRRSSFWSWRTLPGQR